MPFAQLQQRTREFRDCQAQLSTTVDKTRTNDYDQQLRNLVQLSNEQAEKLLSDMKHATMQCEQFQQTIVDLNCRNEGLERRLLEAAATVDAHKRALIDCKEEIAKLKQNSLETELKLLDKQAHLDQLEKELIGKTADLATVTEQHASILVQTQHKDNETQAFYNMQRFQQEVNKNRSPRGFLQQSSSLA